jgi:hypothetical protein
MDGAMNLGVGWAARVMSWGVCVAALMSSGSALASPAEETEAVAEVAPEPSEAAGAKTPPRVDGQTIQTSVLADDVSPSSWGPPPDPLLADEEVPDWPSSRVRSRREALVSDPQDEPVAGANEFLGDPVEDRTLTARRAQVWVRAGVVGVVAGSVLIAGGLAMRFSNSCAFGAGNNCFTDARNRAAATMGVPGGLMLGGGVAMILVGETQRKRLRVTPTVSRTVVGTSIHLRF